MGEVSRILAAIDRGDPGAAERLLPLVYNELRRLAARRMARQRAGHPSQPTDLVPEAFLRPVKDGDDRPWDSRDHSFAGAAEAMRRVLVDGSRRAPPLSDAGPRGDTRGGVPRWSD
jgi:DNA-directed RNA polymerase specialized sigma24 family protein